ncbi:MAG: hypothetical protein AVO33_10705 [delta proteobacterium ML8_F1]|nr:MAG: hypothetical protein AVO33_10705 [delta proteobacterium ML8_F1]
MFSLIKFLVRTYYRLLFRIRIEGEENLPQHEGYLLAANHIHLHDPLVIGAFFPVRMRVMAKKEIFKNPLFNWVLTTMGAFSVDRGGNDIKAIKQSLKILKNKEPLLIFPEGTRNPYKGRRHLPGKAGVPLIALKSRVRIVPVTIDSSYRLFGVVRILYHPPIALWEKYPSKLSARDYEEIAEELLDQIYERVALNQ